MAQQHTPAAGSGQHEPTPPVVPSTHPDQRYFSGNSTDYSVVVDNARKGAHETNYTVYRNARRDDVDVQLSVNALGFDSRTCLTMSAEQLEAFAARLLDAAHDLRTHSAQALAEQRIADEVAA